MTKSAQQVEEELRAQNYHYFKIQWDKEQKIAALDYSPELFDLLPKDADELKKLLVGQVFDKSLSWHAFDDGNYSFLEIPGAIHRHLFVQHIDLPAERVLFLVLVELQKKRFQAPTDIGSDFVQYTVDKLPAIFYAKSVTGKFLMVNEAFRKNFGLDDHQILGKSNHEIFPPETAEEFRRNDLQILVTGQSLESIEVAADLKGVKRYYHSFKFPYLDQNSQVYASGGISLDVTELVESQQAKDQYLAILEMSREVDALFHQHKEPETVGMALIELLTQRGQLFAITAPELILADEKEVFVSLGRQPGSYFWNMDLAEKKSLWAHFCSEHSDPHQAPFYSLCAHRRELNFLIFPLLAGESLQGFLLLRNPDAEIPTRSLEFLRSFATHSADLLYKVQARRELEKQGRLLMHRNKLISMGELAAGLGHEINNPLAIMNGYTEMLETSLRQQGLKASDEQLLEKIKNAMQRIANLVKDFKSFSRADSDELEHYLLQDCLLDSVRFVEQIYNKENLQFFLELSEDFGHCRLLGSRGRMQQVFMNLFANARDATQGQETREIRISGQKIAGEYLLEIRDNGPGIADELQDKIFDLFFTTKAVDQGTGIGLSLVHNIVHEQGGRIELCAETSGGACFLLRFPL